MTLQHLKNLSKKRIINMKRLYKKAGLGVSSMNSRISTMNGSLAKEEQEELELAAIELIEEVALTLELEPGHLANGLGLPTKKQNGNALEPYGYLETKGKPIPIFGRKDKIKELYKKGGTDDPQYWEQDRIINSIVNNGRFTPTDRGKQLMK